MIRVGGSPWPAGLKVTYGAKAQSGTNAGVGVWCGRGRSVVWCGAFNLPSKLGHCIAYLRPSLVQRASSCLFQVFNRAPGEGGREERKKWWEEEM